MELFVQYPGKPVIHIIEQARSKDVEACTFFAQPLVHILHMYTQPNLR